MVSLPINANLTRKAVSLTKHLTIISDALQADALQSLIDAVVPATDPAQMTTNASFWYTLGDGPRNIVDSAAESLRQYLPEFTEGVVGVEWWIGRINPPYGDNFPYGLHTDWGINPSTKRGETPTLSSILYLTSVNDGALVLYPEGEESPVGTLEYVLPRKNLFAMFSGNVTHNVRSRKDVWGIPGDAAQARISIQFNWWKFRPTTATGKNLASISVDYNGTIFPELAIAGPGQDRSGSCG
ncbi:2OG-Fe(II) oxygenase [Streptomyces sp. NPDC002659]|uniref:2OG-Fe(II) oxygenase n=1 Tax=Streptomyces sp. NPDC002659 TaxID=3364656 RepID=UPI003683D719